MKLVELGIGNLEENFGISILDPFIIERGKSDFKFRTSLIFSRIAATFTDNAYYWYKGWELSEKVGLYLF